MYTLQSDIREESHSNSIPAIAWEHYPDTF